MLWSDKHPDGAIARLAAGLLDPSERVRVANHVRGCPRCTPTYERAIAQERTLDSRDPLTPSVGERAAIELRGLPAALAAARPARAAAPWWRPVLVLAAASAAAVIMVFTGPKVGPRPAESEFASRGAEVKSFRLRVFCAPPQGQLAELTPGSSCPQGSTIAFAGGAAGGMNVAVVSLHAGDREITSPEIPVRGGLGSEVPLNFTPLLDVPEGPAHLVVAFGASESEAREALASGAADRTRKLDFQVGNRP